MDRMDNLTPEKRSERMARVRDRDTGPEMTVRRLLHRLGYRYRLQRRDLPGRPDIAFIGRRKAIFVHGCFWHQHDCPRGKRRPASNSAYWERKLDRNVSRDRQANEELEQLGWLVLTIWECEMRDQETLEARLVAFLEEA